MSDSPDLTVLDDLKKPFNLLSMVIAVLGILMGVYFYLESRQRREPYYLLHQSSQIYSKAVTSPKITVIDSLGKAVSGNIHVLELSFWNAGKLSIEPPDVRTPIFLEFPEGYRLLDFNVVRQNKPAVTAFKLSELPTDNASQPRVRLDWAHLDPGLGARLQFIYVGDANPKLRFKGDILDAEILDASAVLDRTAAGWLVMAAVMAILITGVFLMISIEVRHQPNKSSR